MSVSTSKSTVGDLLIEMLSPAFNLESVKIDNPHADSEVTFPIGTPLVVATGVPVAAADIATATGITLEESTVPYDETAKIAVPALARGPAVVNKSALPTTDYAGASFNMTNFAARLVALGMVVRTELAVTETQST